MFWGSAVLDDVMLVWFMQVSSSHFVGVGLPGGCAYVDEFF